MVALQFCWEDGYVRQLFSPGQHNCVTSNSVESYPTTVELVISVVHALDVILSVFSAGWKYSKGFISADMISANLPKPADDTLIIMCGPPPMINFACTPNLDKLGYPANMRFSY